MNFGIYYLFVVLVIECQARNFRNLTNHPSFYKNLQTDVSYSKISNSSFIRLSSSNKDYGKRLVANEPPSVIQSTERMVKLFDATVQQASVKVSDITSQAMAGVKALTNVGSLENIEPKTLQNIGENTKQLKELDENMKNDLVEVDADVEDIQHGLPSKMNGENPHPALYLINRNLKDISIDLYNTEKDAEQIAMDYKELLANTLPIEKSVQQNDINSQTPIGEAINAYFNIGANATSLNENLQSMKQDVDDDF